MVVDIVYSGRLIAKLDLDRNNEKLYCDAQIVVGGEIFHCHRFLLDVVSGYFNRMFRNEFKDSAKCSVEVRGPIGFAITPSILNHVLQFVYTGSLDLSLQNIRDVIHAASYLDMEYLIDYCVSFTASSITGKSWLDIYRVAKHLHLDTLELVCIKSFHYVWADFNFKQASFLEMYDILKSEPEKLNGENTIRVVLSWVVFDEPARTEKLGALLELVSFKSVSRPFIEEEVTSGKYMRVGPEIVRFINEKLAERRIVVVSEWGWTVENAVFKYCPVKKEILHCSTPPFPCDKSAAVLDEDHIVVVGKYRFRSPLHIQIYCVPKNRWFVAESVISQPRFPTAIAIAQGVLFIIAGLDITGAFMNSVEGYHVTPQSCSRQPIEFPSLKVARARHALITRNDQIYIIGGFNFDYLKSCEVLDPSTRTIRDTGMLNHGRHGHAASVTSCGNYIIVSGGYDSHGVAITSVESYSFATEMWTVYRPLIHARWGHSSCSFDGKLYVIGGYGKYASSVEIYDPMTSQWSLHHYIEYQQVSGSVSSNSTVHPALFEHFP